MAIDICNTCTVFQNHIQDAMDDRKEDDEKMEVEERKQDDEMMEDEEKKHDPLKTLQQHFQSHLNEASFGYQANAAMIDHAKKSWKVKILKTYPKMSFNESMRQLLADLKIKPGSTIHVTIDWDRDRNEFQRQHKKFYNKEKPQFISLNIKIEPETDKGICIHMSKYLFIYLKIYVYNITGGEIVILWSKMFGGKRHFHIIQALEWFFDEFNVKAEHLYISNDYQFCTQYYLRYLSWLCHPDNPNRRFKSVLFAAYVLISLQYLLTSLQYLLTSLDLRSAIPIMVVTASMLAQIWHIAA